MSIVAYIYPITDRTEKIIHNPYIDNFIANLPREIEVINKNRPSKIGTLDIVRYFHKTNLFFFNWIENLPEKKYGIIQSCLFLIIFLPLSKLTRKKIIWTLHNKEPHDNKKRWWKTMLFKTMLKYSDYIITHAEDGVDMINSMTNKQKKQIIYFPHPFNTREIQQFTNKDIDILIWGTMARYKGIHNFVQLVNENTALQNIKIQLMGKFTDKTYKKEITELNKHNIDIIDEYIPKDKLNNYLNRAKAILFTYQEDSILSSGALCDSIGFGGIIIGPETGAFKDLEKRGLVLTYKRLDQIPIIIKNISSMDVTKVQENQQSFIEEYHWKNLPSLIEPIIK